MSRRLQIALAVTLMLAAGVAVVLGPRLARLARPDAAAARAVRELAPLSIRQALGAVRDPELDADIVELGLVHEILVDGSGAVTVRLLLTTPLCPLADTIAWNVRRVLRALPGVRKVDVVIDRDTPWSWERATPEVRRRLGVTVP